ncbi:hypothetical protein J2S15_000727 [Breznakia pachnodae]|uniref:Uncharacterized protein n=1 Tax=Breznakia pachnodae TaxID=265178 RepID=A0ABU0DZI9_9FIRM|nr:hypothetical protein [Breznakia pachnodae]
MKKINKSGSNPEMAVGVIAKLRQSSKKVKIGIILGLSLF